MAILDVVGFVRREARAGERFAPSKCLAVLSIALWHCSVGIAHAQDAAPPVEESANTRIKPVASRCAASVRRHKLEDPKIGAYHLANRANEDYSYLKDPSCRKDFFDPVKYIPLFGNPDVYMTIDGEQRIRYESIGNSGNLGIASTRLPNGTLKFGPQEDLTMLRTRTVVGAALNVTDNFKAYTQIVSAQQDGGVLPGRAAPPVYDSPVQLVQGFVEPKAHIGDADVGARIGRQLVWLGNGMFMLTNPRTSVPRPILDGALGYIETSNAKLDAFSFKVVNTAPGAFQEYPSNVTLSGAYLTYDLLSSGPKRASAPSRLAFDAFYFNYDGTYSPISNGGIYYDRAFLTGAAITPTTGFTYYTGDNRNTVGGRLSGAFNKWDFDLTGAYQFGKYGPYNVDAFMAQGEIGYRFWDPNAARFSLRAGLASGGADKQAHTLSTYQPMSGPLNYTENSDFSLTNMYHFSQHLYFKPLPQLMPFFTMEAFNSSFWRYSLTDAVYGGTWQLANGPNIFAVTAATSGRYIGTQPGLRFIFTPDQHAKISFTLAKLYVGSALSQGGAKDTTYGRFDLTYRF